MPLVHVVESKDGAQLLCKRTALDLVEWIDKASPDAQHAIVLPSQAAAESMAETYEGRAVLVIRG